MILSPGARLGPYEIVSAIGAGGMGEVYRARDTRLDRDVALKVLPAAFAADAERLARFHREAKTLAALNHPNIGALYGIEETAPGQLPVLALVMEFVDGEDLASRLERGPLPLVDALPVARQIADALEAAHGVGIIHRDLKPANIKVRSDGSVKLLDFGLAKAMDPVGAADLSHSPTALSPAITHAGIIMGTAAYMSPEQARGRSVDKRTDVWAFGCVLYELLTGQRAFAGDDASEVLASVLAREPDLTMVPAAAPPSLRRLLRRCLQKDPAVRLRDIGDARLEIDEAIRPLDAEPNVPSPPRAPRRNRERLAWIGALIAMTLALVSSLIVNRRTIPHPSEMRVDIVTPPTAAPQSLAISPDGNTLAFVATADGQSRLWVRSLQSGMSRVVAGTDGAVLPFWSPDSRSVAFFADDRLKRVDVDGGSVQTIATARGGLGGTWNADNVILYAALGRSIARVSASGGEAVQLSRLAQQGSDFSPAFLPDGRQFIYYVRGNPEVRGVYASRLDGTLEPRRLLDCETAAVYAASGHLLFVRQGTLFAQGFDPARLEMTDKPVPVVEGVGVDGPIAGVSVSHTGGIVYRGSAAAAQRQFVWFGRGGTELGSLGDPVTTTLGEPSLSRDGRRVAFYGSAGGSPDIWLLDTRRGVFSRFTSDPSDDVFPIWSPDGSRVVFSSNRNGVHDLYEKSAIGDRSEELLLATAQPKNATDWSADGRFVLFNTRDWKESADIWALSLAERGKILPVAHTAFDEQGGQFSPDGNWIAYQSNNRIAPKFTFGRFAATARRCASPPTAAARYVGGRMARRSSTSASMGG